MNITEENINQAFRLKEIDETENDFIEEIKQNELLGKKHKRVCKILNYTKHLSILASTVTGHVFISAFASLIGISVGIASSVATIKICIINAKVKKHQSIIIRAKKKKQNKIALLGKTKLNTVGVLTSKALVNSNISHYEFATIDNVLKVFNEMKKEINIIPVFKKESKNCLKAQSQVWGNIWQIKAL